MLPHRLLPNHSWILLSSPYAFNLELVIIYVFKEVTVIFLCLVENVKQRLCLIYKQDFTPKSIYKKKSLINHHYEFRRIFESLSFFVFPFLVNESAVLSSIPRYGIIFIWEKPNKADEKNYNTYGTAKSFSLLVSFFQ